MRFIIFALNYKDANRERAMVETLFNYTHRECIGMYKGVKEYSYKVPYKEGHDFALVKELARKFNQESILVVTGNEDAFLYYIESGKTQPLGTWTNVSEDEANSNNNWTYCDGQYYIVR